MSATCFGWVKRNYIADRYPDATRIRKLLLSSLADEANDVGTSCYPGLTLLAETSLCSVGAARANLDALEKQGLIVILRPARQGRGHYNRYGVVMDQDPAEVLDRVRAEAGLDPVDKPVNPVDNPGSEPNIKGSPGDPFTEINARKGYILEQETRGKGTPRVCPTHDPVPIDPVIPGSDSVTPQPAAVDNFEEFWSSYPVKKGKAVARKRWSSMSPAQRAAAIAAVPLYMADSRPGYRQHGSTWLSQKTWEDYDAEPEPEPEPEPVVESVVCELCTDGWIELPDSTVARCATCHPDPLDEPIEIPTLPERRDLG